MSGEKNNPSHPSKPTKKGGPSKKDGSLGAIPKTGTSQKSSPPLREEQPRWFLVRVDPSEAGTRIREGRVSLTQAAVTASGELLEPTEGTVTWMLEQLGYPKGPAIRNAIARPIMARENRIAETIRGGNLVSLPQVALAVSKAKAGQMPDIGLRPKGPSRVPPKERTEAYTNARAKMEGHKALLSRIGSEIKDLYPGWKPRDVVTNEIGTIIGKDLVDRLKMARANYETSYAAFNKVRDSEKSEEQLQKEASLKAENLLKEQTAKKKRDAAQNALLGEVSGGMPEANTQKDPPGPPKPEDKRNGL